MTEIPAWSQALLCQFNNPSRVRIDGRQLIVERRRLDGSLDSPRPYSMKGVNWAPASKGSSVDDRQAQHAVWYATDIPLMKEMNVNTIRVFLDFGTDQSACNVLDELHRHEIMAIVTVDKMVNDTANITTVVNAYKNHPAVLMWSLGNEWNVNSPGPYFGKFADIASAALATEAAAQQIKALDTNHPVASSYGEIDIPGLTPLSVTQEIVNIRAPSVDLWGLNIFRGLTFGNLFRQWASISTKPMFLGEFGTDAFNQNIGNEHQAIQANFNAELWDEIASNLSADDSQRAAIGGLIFEWNDEWWKAGNPSSHDTGGFAFAAHPDGFANEEWFGCVDIERVKRQCFFTFQAKFSSPPLVAAVLPSSRSVQIGTPATAFATMINAGQSTATSCSIAPLTSVSATFVYQTTNPATNQVTGTPNTPVDVAPGVPQSFVVALTPTAAIAPTDVQFSFDCANTAPAPINSGLNTLLFSASTTPIPDIVALVATLTNDGIVNIPGATGTGAFAVATVNVGATATITASADTGTATLPLSISLCETNPATSQCISFIGPTVTIQIDANATPTFGIFVQGNGNVPFDPATNRIFVRFKDSGNVTRGSTSVAVQTQ